MEHDGNERTPSEQEWLRVRHYLRESRHELAASAAAEFDVPTVDATPLLTRPEWIPPTPIALESIDLEWTEDVSPPAVMGTEAALPMRTDGSRYEKYSDAMRDLAAPTVFENRPTYRLVSANLSEHGQMMFTRGAYFDAINTGEAAAHEFAHGLAGGRRVREAIANPCDPAQRPTNLAITTVTIRHDRETGDASFLLHWRDPAKVGHAGGLYQVLPVGIFQPSGDAMWNEKNDFSLWRNIIREFAEELLEESEDHGSEQAPIDYSSWPLASRLTQAREMGVLRAYCLGIGVDPLTFATDLLTAVVIDARLYDELFGGLSESNAEGRILDAQPFDAQNVEKIVHDWPMQAAGAAALVLAVNGDVLNR